MSLHRDCSRRGRLRRIKVADWPLDLEVILEGIDGACAFRHVEDSGTFGIFWALVGFATEEDIGGSLTLGTLLLGTLLPLSHITGTTSINCQHVHCHLHCPSD
ncbi:hypothetical protein E4U26_004827 [Claviceps purpurea]|nr:hypothetical protein E4U26_004827 [Claviceps purpurea]